METRKRFLALSEACMAYCDPLQDLKGEHSSVVFCFVLGFVALVLSHIQLGH